MVQGGCGCGCACCSARRGPRKPAVQGPLSHRCVVIARHGPSLVARGDGARRNRRAAAVSLGRCPAGFGWQWLRVFRAVGSAAATPQCARPRSGGATPQPTRSRAARCCDPDDGPDRRRPRPVPGLRLRDAGKARASWPGSHRQGPRGRCVGSAPLVGLCEGPSSELFPVSSIRVDPSRRGVPRRVTPEAEALRRPCPLACRKG